MHFAALSVMQRFIKTFLLIPNWLLLRSVRLEKGHLGTFETINACRDTTKRRRQQPVALLLVRDSNPYECVRFHVFSWVQACDVVLFMAWVFCFYSVSTCCQPIPVAARSKGVCTHTGKTGVGSDSIAGCNVNKWVLSHAAGPAELPARQICVPD